MLLKIIVYLAVYCFLGGETKLSYNDFPTSIPKYSIRLDAYTNKPVKSGLAHSLSGRVTLKEFKRHMQCVDNEPNFNYNSGSITLMEAIRLSKESIKLLCAFREKRCGPWKECQRHVEQYDAAGNLTTTLDLRFSFDKFFLYRIIDGQLHYDWPWSIERFGTDEDGEVIKLLKVVLPAISDLKDSVFFAGGEVASIPYDYPFPLFSSAPRMGNADMPWPWLEAWRSAQHLFFHLKERNQDINDEHVYHAAVPGYLPWEQKVPKAAFFATYERARAIMFDTGRRYPDLFDIGLIFIDCNYPWNPLSTEDCLDREQAQRMKQTNYSHLPSGYISPFANYDEARYHPGSYKYVIVPMGNEAQSTSGRLPILLANSGAVVLMPRMPLVYHFSAQLQPWVHYVPLAYNGADLLDKVKWLRDHDDLARQIAENGRVFARSYLRLEDYYCYAANAMEMLAELQEGTNATEPFHPVKMKPDLPGGIRPLIQTKQACSGDNTTIQAVDCST